jgi:hypothetical protein
MVPFPIIGILNIVIYSYQKVNLDFSDRLYAVIFGLSHGQGHMIKLAAGLNLSAVLDIDAVEL